MTSYNPDEPPDFAAWLAAALQQRGLPARHLAAPTGLSAAALSQILARKVRPKQSTVLALAQALGVEAPYREPLEAAGFWVAPAVESPLDASPEWKMLRLHVERIPEAYREIAITALTAHAQALRTAIQQMARERQDRAPAGDEGDTVHDVASDGEDSER